MKTYLLISNSDSEIEGISIQLYNYLYVFS